MSERRLLTFKSLDEVMPEVERLLAGHKTLGRWSLGQILHHLATALRLCLGTSRSSLPAAEKDDENARRFEVNRRLFFRAGRFPDGAELPLPILNPSADADARVQAESLSAAIEAFRESPGPFSIHPRLGSLSKEEWDRFHCIHSAHHLGFVVPHEPGVGESGESKLA